MVFTSTNTSLTKGQRRRLEIAVFIVMFCTIFVSSTLYIVPAYRIGVVIFSLYFVLFVAWLAYLIHRRMSFPGSVIDVPVALLLSWLLITSIASIEPLMSFNEVVLYFIYILLYYLLVDRLRAGWPPKPFFRALIVIVVIVYLLALFEFLAWYIFGFGGSGQGWWALGGWQNPIPPRLLRLRYTLFNPNLAGVFIAVMLPVWLAVAFVSKIRWRKFGASAGFVVGLIVLMLTLSRSAMLGAGLGLLTFGFLLSSRYGLAHIKTSALRYRWLILVMFILVVLLGLILANPVSSALDRPSSSQMRLQLWGNSLKLIQEHPLFGTGPDTFGQAIMAYWNPSQIFFPFVQAHNLPLQVAAEVGIVGLLLVLWLAVVIVRAGYRQFLELPTRPAIFMAAAISGLFAFAGQSLADSLIDVFAIALPLIIFAAICTFAAKPSNRFNLSPSYVLVVTIVAAVWSVWSLYGQQQFDRALSANDAGEWESAAKKIDQLPPVVIPPGLYNFKRGFIYGRLAQQNPQSDAFLSTAIDSYRSGLAETPVYIPGHANLAALYWQQGNLPEAINALNTTIDSTRIAEEPEVVLYQFNLGYLYEQNLDTDQAIQIYAQILTVNPSLAASLFWQETDWRRQNFDKILSEVEQHYDEIYAGPGLAQYRKGQLAVAAGNLDRAEQFFRSSIAAGNNSAELALSQLLISQQEPEGAEILNTLPPPPETTTATHYILRGQVELAAGHDLEAEYNLRLASFLGVQTTNYYLGRLALSNNNIDGAISYLKQAIPANLNINTFHRNYDYLIYRLVHPNDRPYDGTLLPVVFIPPTVQTANTYLELADLYLANGDVGAARQTLEQLLELAPNYQPALEKLERLPQ